MEPLMARRNPGISPILSARGYGARVLWPQYTPDGGINSGSEIPVPPRNTLQSNQSNLIYRENPFTPVTQNAPGRIQVTSKRGKTLYMTENQIRKMGAKMLADGEIERALGRSNPKRPAKRPIKSVPKGAGRSSGKGIGTGLRSFGKKSSQTSGIEQQYAHELFESGGKQLEQYLANMSQDEQSKFATDYADLLENPKAYKAGQGKFRRETQKSMQRAQHQAAAEAEAAGYSYPRSFVTPSDSKFHQKKWYDGIQIYPNPRIKRGAGDAPKRMGAFAEFEERMKREMAAAGQYPESDLRSNPFGPTSKEYPAGTRLTPNEMALFKGHIEQLLASGMSHADVRKELGNMSFPKYNAIRRSGR